MLKDDVPVNAVSKTDKASGEDKVLANSRDASKLIAFISSLFHVPAQPVMNKYIWNGFGLLTLFTIFLKHQSLT